MINLSQFRITWAIAARMLADAAMVGFALAAGLAIRFLLTLAIHGHTNVVSYEQEFWEYVQAFAHNAGILVVLCLFVFACSGFYTYGRAYQGRYKALVIIQAVVHSYLGFGVLTYLFWDHLGLTHVPRGALLFAWVLNLGLTLASRTWTFLWEQVIRPERVTRLRANDRPVRTVLVVGGAGYIGSALLPKLLQRGYKVRVLDAFLYGEEPIASVLSHPKLDLIDGDFRHVERIVEAMNGVDAVVHLGAIVGDPACDLDEQVTIDVNLTATKMIAQVAKASGVRRLVFASTCSVYGACDEILDERSEVKPISLYGNTKLVAERGLQSMADDSFAPTVLRFATIYGLSGRTRFDLVVNLLAAKAKIDGKITVHGGDQWRPFVHVDDAARAILNALQAPLSHVGNQVFNVGSDEQNYTIQQVGRIIQDQVIGAELLCDHGAQDRRNYRVSFRKIRNLLGFEPRWTIEDGVRQVVEAVASGNVLDYQDSKYSNVKYLSQSGAIEVIRLDDDWSKALPTAPAAAQFAG